MKYAFEYYIKVYYKKKKKTHSSKLKENIT